MTSKAFRKAIAVADAATLYLALTVLAIIMLSSLRGQDNHSGFDADAVTRGAALSATGARPCDEIYVVGEGETLHTIGDKCGDPFVAEQNPHVHDPDEVFPGLVLSITPSRHHNYR